MVQPLLTLANTLPTTRIQRRPRHDFYVSVRPWQIQPFCIAPVLPGETLESVHMQAREVSKPVANPLIGWNSEWYLFYVKIRDLNDRDTLDDLFINPTASVSSLNSAADVATYHVGGSPNYTNLCLRRVVETYFRDEGETWNTNLVGGLPAAQITNQRWMDSLVDTTVLSAGAGNPAVDPATPEALDKMMDAYEYLRSMNLTNMNFEDYLRTFGVSISKAEVHKPELIWKKRDWKYPVNTVEPTTGAPSSALSFVLDENSRDSKFFREPGFLFGVHVMRPKVWFANQKGSLTHFLDQGLSWLPAIMRESPETSLREFASGATSGPLAAAPTNGYWVDMRDLFLYGDQFMNVAPTTTGINSVALPTAALVRKYADATMADTLFAAASPANVINSDGIIQFAIKGNQRDMTDGIQAEGR